MIALFLNQAGGCDAQPATVQRIGNQDFQVLQWVCGAQSWKAYQRHCQSGSGEWWGRPFFLEETNGHTALYLNRFAELQVGRGAQMFDAYLPGCGS